jgi:hypothetical protein
MRARRQKPKHRDGGRVRNGDPFHEQRPFDAADGLSGLAGMDSSWQIAGSDGY